MLVCVTLCWSIKTLIQHRRRFVLLCVGLCWFVSGLCWFVLGSGQVCVGLCYFVSLCVGLCWLLSGLCQIRRFFLGLFDFVWYVQTRVSQNSL